MADKGWKKWEREVAADLGGQRTGPQGKNLPDVSGIEIAPECKYYSALMLRTRDLDQAKFNAKEKPWVIPMKAKGDRKGAIAILPYDFFVELYWAWIRSKEQN